MRYPNPAGYTGPIATKQQYGQVKLGTEFTPISFTPTLTFGGLDTGNVYGTANTYGTYIMSGALIFFNGRLILNTKGTSTGIAQLANLPLPTNGLINSQAIAINAQAGITLDAGFTYTFGVFPPASTAANINEAGSNVGSQILTDANFTNGSFIEFSGFYIIG